MGKNLRIDTDVKMMRILKQLCYIEKSPFKIDLLGKKISNAQ